MDSDAYCRFGVLEVVLLHYNRRGNLEFYVALVCKFSSNELEEILWILAFGDQGAAEEIMCRGFYCSHY